MALLSPTSLPEHLAVCSWSLQPENPKALVDALHAVGVSKIQIEIDPIRDDASAWVDVDKVLADGGIQVVGAMFRTLGEDYSTLETIKVTGGIVPDATWDGNWSNIQANVPIIQKLGAKVVTFHAGFLPHDHSDPEYSKLLNRLGQIADLYASEGLELAFETGQETAPDLNAFLDDLNRSNTGVNFDPANMILYDKGDPIEALRVLGPRIKQTHVKDATRTKTPGEWGEEVVVGTGEVDWPAYFAALDSIGFDSYLAIEREAGDSRVADIRAAREHLEKLAGGS